MPNFRNTVSRSPVSIFRTFLPSTKISPLSGRIMPSTHLIITDLPVPDPPITTSDSPFGTVRLMPSSTTFLPKRLWTFLSSIFASLMTRPSIRKQKRRHHIVRREDQDGCCHHCIRRRAANALRAALRVEAVEAAHDRNDEAEHGSLDEAGNDIIEFQEIDRVLDIDAGVEVERLRAHHKAA